MALGCDKAVRDQGQIPPGDIQELHLALPIDSAGGNLGPVGCTGDYDCAQCYYCNTSTGGCVARASGAGCDDGKACTKGDTCNGSGACIGAVNCPASDQCHDPGACDGYGNCTNPAKPDNSSCSDGNACTQGDTCQGGSCQGGGGVSCGGGNQCRDPGTCDPTTGMCLQGPAKANGTPCSDGNACTQGDSCQSGSCQGGNAVSCPSSQCRDAGTCDPATGMCATGAAKANGTPCNDSNACTRSDTCQSGACVGASPVTCAPTDQCHDTGTCDTATGMCSNPVKADGASCSDGNACTRTDTCQAGVCRGASPVACTALDQCHTAGTCDPATGSCSNPNKADGTGCNDGNACTRSDACLTGVCKGNEPVVCSAQDQCHVAGTCDTATGSCSNPPKTGARCDDANACSYEDTCTSDGACVGKPVMCTSDDFATRTCNGTSTCTVTPKPGAACDDGNPCTKGDVRQPDGSCAGMPYTCPVTACVVSASCDGNGGCNTVAKPDGTSCDADQSKCTPHDACKGGICTPDSKPVTCIAKDCNTASCDPASGNCVYKPTSGGQCGLSGCYTMGTCNNGVCSGKPKDCSAMNGPCAEGVCDAASGQCMSAPKPNGTRCSAGGKCADSAVCAFGVCELAAMTCPAASAPCKLPACDPETGQCVENKRAPGSSCDPKNGCLTDAICDMDGNCIGAPVPNGEPCTLAGGQVGRCAAGMCIAAAGNSGGGQMGGGGNVDAGVDGPAGGSSMGGGGTNGKSGSGKSGCAIAHAAGSDAASPLALLAALAMAALFTRRRRSRS